MGNRRASFSVRQGTLDGTRRVAGDPRCTIPSGSRPGSRCARKKRTFTMVRTVRRGKSGLHRVGWRLITARREASNRATETSPDAGNRVGGETRQPAPGATPNRQALTRPAELAGRWLEPWSDPRPRGLAVEGRKVLQNPAYRPASPYSFHLVVAVAQQPAFPLTGRTGYPRKLK